MASQKKNKSGEAKPSPRNSDWSISKDQVINTIHLTGKLWNGEIKEEGLHDAIRGECTELAFLRYSGNSVMGTERLHIDSLHLRTLSSSICAMLHRVVLLRDCLQTGSVGLLECRFEIGFIVEVPCRISSRPAGRIDADEDELEGGGGGGDGVVTRGSGEPVVDDLLRLAHGPSDIGQKLHCSPLLSLQYLSPQNDIRLWCLDIVNLFSPLLKIDTSISKQFCESFRLNIFAFILLRIP